ncbi:hypothetical protein ACSBR2_020856 [Camellia fascicularis]
MDVESSMASETDHDPTGPNNNGPTSEQVEQAPAAVTSRSPAEPPPQAQAQQSPVARRRTAPTYSVVNAILEKKITPFGEPPTPRAAHVATAVGSMVVIQGGIGLAGLSAEDLHVLDLTQQRPRWHRVVVQGPGPGPRYGHVIALVGQRYLMAIGGNDGEPLDICFILCARIHLDSVSSNHILVSSICIIELVAKQIQKGEYLQGSGGRLTTILHSNMSPPYEVDECRGVLRVYSDDSIVRSSKPSFNVPVHDNSSVIWKDVQFDSTNNLYLRLYKPATSSSAKLPIFFYIHGDGFCIGSQTWPNCQNYCFRLALDLQALIISPDYRLAPENWLPAAIEDGYMAVKWLTLQTQAKSDPWLGDVVDFSRVFISGDSSGGNMAHYLAVRLGAGSGELDPVRVRGYVLLAPFFGGTVLTRFEAEGPKDAFLNWELIDRFWRLSIPIGETTDHPLVNPFGPVSPNLESKDLDPMLVVVGGSDLLRDRAEDYARKLKG